VVLVAGLCASLLVVFLAGAAVALADACPNAAFRDEGPSANLPNCRAYEMVTPVEKNGGDVVADGTTNISAQSGNGLVFASRVGFGDVEGTGVAGSWEYVASRGAGGWVTHAVTPTPSLEAEQLFIGGTFNIAFSPELDRSIVEGYALPGASGAVPNSPNLYLEDSSTRSLQTLTTPLGEEAIFPFSMLATYRGTSSDLGVTILQASANLLPGLHDSEPKLYVNEHGVLRLAGILPDGSIPAGGSAGPREEYHQEALFNDAISRDGSRIMFISPAYGSSSQLYVRRDAHSTVWVSQSEASNPNPTPEGIRFQGATPDGMKILFTSASPLLDADPGQSAGEVGLYLYSESAHPETDSNLTFIARMRNEGASGVLGISEDGSHVYFAVGGGVSLWDEGETHSIPDATISEIEQSRADLSADGRRFTFFSKESDGQMYLYNQDDDKLTCVSCPANGEPPTDPTEEDPHGTRTAVTFGFPYFRHYLSRDGRYAFFSTATALVPEDTNKLPDAYEYEVDTGKVSLLSSGTGEYGSWFTAASPDGHDAFIVTRQPMSGWDVDELTDIYDARVDGGLPEPSLAKVPCAGDACQGTPSAAPAFNTASEFRGTGNVSAKPAAKQRSALRSSKLTAALKACRKKPQRKRRACERRALKRYATRRSVRHTALRAGR
jgi:hypothetical protein